jgi:signal transduction histidine kinase/ligand-binding sensor domain-containing protein/DNA-binding response OmpR family regulator
MTRQFYIIIITLIPLLLFSQPPQLQFEHINTSDGMSNNSISCILQDRQGFMWFGTSDGLDRWDGYTFKIFSHDANDSNSISNNTIWSIHEDSSGNIWVGTENGLNKYNPLTESFIVYLTDKTDSNSISNNILGPIFEDNAENIWIGTENGLNRYNRKSNNFSQYFFPGQFDSVSFWWNNNTIRAINETEDGKLLLGTTNDFLIFNPQTGKTTTVPYVIPGRKRWPSVTTIYKDRVGMFWIGIADDGVIEYNPQTGKPRLYETDPNDPYSYSSLFSNAFCEDKNGQLWIGSGDQGLSIFDRIGRRFIHYKSENKDETSFKGPYVRSIYEDKQGNIWIGTQDSGINLVKKWNKSFRHYVHDSQNPNSLGQEEVTNFLEDKDGVLWITHFLGGISLFNQNTGNFSHITHDPKNPASMSRGGLYGICEDSYGYIWLAVTPYLDRFDRKTGIFKHYRYDSSNPRSHAYTFTLCCYEDHQRTMWFGTNNAGLERFNRADETFDRFCYDEVDSNSISENCIFSLYQDRMDHFWIGTWDGLCQLVYDTTGREKFIRYQPDPANPESITGKEIYAIYQDRAGRLWIGTEAGLNLFDLEKQSFKALTEKDGLPSNIIYGVLEDDQGLSEGKAGNLWLRTLRGIVKFNPETGKLRVYDEGDGLRYCKSIQQGYAAFYKGKNGEMYSGGANSVTVFHPDSLKDNPDPPKIAITDFKINYQTVKINPKSPLKKSVTFSDLIKLDYHQNIISFEFAALDYTAPAKNQYAYKLEGVNPDWVFTGASQRFATYTNLAPGEYVFRVKASNNDGVWNEAGASIRIVITPPWWKTTWAYGLYFLLMVSLIYGAWRFQLNRLRMRHDLEMKQLQAEKLEEVNRMKSHFFANISHEFRTPLTLILGPISQMFSQTRRPDFRENLSLMKRNALRLQRLINQLLDLSKLEAGRMKLQVREENIVTLLRSFVQAFESLAKLKNIQLVFRAEQENIPAYIDREKLETIVNNLLSNSFKFTPAGGKVIVAVNIPLNPPSKGDLHAPPFEGGSGGMCEIGISDTGFGIPTDRLPHIFDRFYRVDDSYTSEPAPLDSSSLKKYPLGEKFYPTGQEGTGIGLALTKELVEFHKGEISVTSQVGKGTTFVIRLPIEKAVYKDKEIVDIPIPLSPFAKGKEIEIPPFEGGIGGMLEIQESQNKPYPEKPAKFKKSLPVLLIVEDNSNMRIYIRSNLENTYRIIDAEDGEKGFLKCAKALPDLVISDVMMPKMNGFQLCARLKQDERTSHIPVILLTARAAAEDRIGGLETGADDYLIKPFDARELQVRVKNLIEQRRKLRERFRKEGILQPQEIAITSTDQKFLQKALEIVESHLSDEHFSVGNFGKEIGMSRALLHRKLRALIDHSPSELIRSLRLNHAAQLLAKHGGTVTEIAFQVGFNNLSYFARCFQRQFGVSPSLYAGKNPHS